MRPVFAAAIALAEILLAGAAADAQTPTSALRPCMGRVVYSEELPFAPIGSWLVKMTLEIAPKNGTAYYVTLHERMPWQGAPPRRGQALRLRCDPANPNIVRLASRRFAASSF